MQRFNVHPETPQQRSVQQICQRLSNGEIGAIPTDSCYALIVAMGQYQGMERIRTVRQLDKHHLFTVLCLDLANVSLYAKVGNTAYRLLRKCTPGPYTFVFKATRELPRRIQHDKRKEVGLRIPDHKVLQAVLQQIDQPLLSVSLILPNEQTPLTNPYDIEAALGNQIDFLVDAGTCGQEETTVIALTDDVPVLVRQGKGDSSIIGSLWS